MSNEDLDDIVSESATLSSLYNYGMDAYVQVSDILTDECFTEPTNLALFQCMSTLFKQGIEKMDIPIIRSMACTLGFDYIFTDRTELAHLKGIFNTSVELDNVKTFAGKIRKIQVIKDLKKLTRDIHSDLDKKTGAEPFNEIISTVEDPVFQYCRTLNNSEDIPVSLGEKAEEYLKQVEENPVEIVGISSGYPILDRIIGNGLRPGTCSLFGGRQKSGKSMLSMNVALNVAMRGVHCLYLDLEMNYRDHIPRAVSNILFTNGYKIPIDDIEKGVYSKSIYLKNLVKETSRQFKLYPLKYLNIANRKIEHVSSIIKRWLMTDVKDSGIPLVIYDYIRLSDVSELKNNIQERQILQSIIVHLNNIAMKYNIPILVLTQLNREAINAEHAGTIAGSDAILNTVSNFSIIKFKSAEEIAIDGITNGGNRKLVNVCTRFGAGCDLNDYICFQLHGAYGKLTELNLRSSIRAQMDQVKVEEKKKEDEEDLNLGNI